MDAQKHARVWCCTVQCKSKKVTALCYRDPEGSTNGCTRSDPRLCCIKMPAAGADPVCVQKILHIPFWRHNPCKGSRQTCHSYTESCCRTDYLQIQWCLSLLPLTLIPGFSRVPPKAIQYAAAAAVHTAAQTPSERHPEVSLTSGSTSTVLELVKLKQTCGCCFCSCRS
jgi:hypothetical protein